MVAGTKRPAGFLRPLQEYEFQNEAVKQHYTIEIFSAGCKQCLSIIDDIRIGKYQSCNQTVYDINRMADQVKRKLKNYGVTSIANTIVNGSIKLVGVSNFPWIYKIE